MFRPLSLFLGLRYTRAKRRNHFISFISASSMLGIALGVMVLLTVLSVMNGFDKEIQTRIFQFAPQVVVHNFTGQIEDWTSLSQEIKKDPEVLGISPFVFGQGMLTRDDITNPVVIYGIDPAKEAKISVISKKMVKGSLNSLKNASFNIILGYELAQNLNVTLGDKVTLLTPQVSMSMVGMIPQFKRFTVSGIFRAGNGFHFDDQLAYINLQDAQALYELGSAVSGLRLKIDNFFEAPAISEKIANQLSSEYYVTNWTSDYGPLFSVLKLEKNMMFLILLLIVAVAMFNLVSSLVMVVNDKRADIAILRTLGATPKMILNSFLIQGFVIGSFGTLLGLLGGIYLSEHVTSIVNGLEQLFHVKLLSSNFYYVDYLPSHLILSDVIKVCVAAFVLSVLATIYPAVRAARTQPAEALSYE
ncbi:MAG: lipoprotein-releasing ABC transporter permease subunit [Gammaproteobacteria bacterium]